MKNSFGILLGLAFSCAAGTTSYAQQVDSVPTDTTDQSQFFQNLEEKCSPIVTAVLDGKKPEKISGTTECAIAMVNYAAELVMQYPDIKSELCKITPENVDIAQSNIEEEPVELTPEAVTASSACFLNAYRSVPAIDGKIAGAVQASFCTAAAIDYSDESREKGLDICKYMAEPTP